MQKFEYISKQVYSFIDAMWILFKNIEKKGGKGKDSTK